MKIFMASDFHYGKHTSDSDRWLDIMDSYFYEFFIPLLKAKAKPGDILLILGDIFDNRNSINLKVIQSVVNLFEELAKIINCHVLLGNHDLFLMSDTSINSVSVIRNIKGVTVYDKPTLIDIDGLSALMMPWIHGKDNEKEILEKYKGTDLLFCHSDLNGCRTQLYPTRPANKSILDIDDFQGFGRIFSGHIHIVQTINNFTFVGCPYHLDRNDVENRKGVFVYDTKKKIDIFIENDFSPEYKKINIEQESDIDHLNILLNTNNFIDVNISKKLILNKPELKLELDKISNKYKIESLDFIDDIEDEITKDKKKINYTKDKSIKEVSEEWIDNIKFNVDTDIVDEIEMKDIMKQKINECFKLLELNKK